MTISEQMNAMRNVDIRTVDKAALVDVRGIQFDNSLSQKERIEKIIMQTKNPYCFRFGELGIKVEHTNDGPTLTDLLTDFLIRKQSGL